MLDFTTYLMEFYKQQPVFRRRRFFHGKSLRGDPSHEVCWLDPSGSEMDDAAWNTPHVRCLGVLLFGGHIDVDEYGEPIVGDHVLILFNADHANEIAFALPEQKTFSWCRVLDTSDVEARTQCIKAKTYPLKPVSVAVFTANYEPES